LLLVHGITNVFFISAIDAQSLYADEPGGIRAS